MTSVTTDQRLGVNADQAVKVPCIASSSSNLTLSGEQTIDDIAVVTGDRVLLTGQTTTSENGIWVVDTGAWTRPPDWDGANDVVYGTIVFVVSGTNNLGYWQVSTSGTITVDTTSVTFAQTVPGAYSSTLLMHDVTSQETAAGVTPVNYQYPYGDSRRYGNVGDADNTTQLQNMFAAVTTGTLYIYPGTYNFTNTGGGLSFLDNVDYVGLGDVIIQPSTSTKRIFDTTSKSNFTVKNIRAYGADEDMNNRIGGGYWLFTSCSNFHIEECEMSNHAYEGFKFDTCSIFTVSKCIANYGKAYGFTIDACTYFKIFNCESNKNGLNSSDDSYADLPTGWSGTHVGRGMTLQTVCQHGEISGCNFRLNSEYGIRLYADATNGGCTDIELHHNYYEDNGHPAGTYGPIVLGSDKGIDILINHDSTISDTLNIHIHHENVLRTATDYGQPVVLGAIDSKFEYNEIRLEGSILNLQSAIQLYDWEDSTVIGNKSFGSQYHLTVGGGGTTNVHVEGEKAYDCLKFLNSQLTGNSSILNCYAKHITTAAIAGEDGIVVAGSDLIIIRNCIFDGFYEGINLSVAASKAHITGCTTLNSVDRGIEGTNVTTQDNLEVFGNNFDKAYPGIFATFEYNGRGSLSRAACTFNSNPSTGGANAGSAINWSVGDFFYNSAPSVDGNNMVLVGWVCTVAGTPGTWVAQYISTVSPAT